MNVTCISILSYYWCFKILMTAILDAILDFLEISIGIVQDF